MELSFVKMEGCGNDYVFLTGTAAEDASLDFPALARTLAPRHTGVGSDGLIVVQGTASPPRMAMWNADGSAGELCLNGLRCAALLLVRDEADRPLEFTVETGAGPVPVAVASRERESRVRLRLPAPRITGKGDYALGAAWSRGVRVDAGNPHCVFWGSSVEAVHEAPVAVWGPRVQAHGDFPGGVNVHWARFEDGVITVRHFERGSGETLACGSGALAVWAAAQHEPGASENLRVRMPGGEVRVRGWEDGVELEGPAREVFRGVWVK